MAKMAVVLHYPQHLRAEKCTQVSRASRDFAALRWHTSHKVQQETQSFVALVIKSQVKMLLGTTHATVMKCPDCQPCPCL